MFGGIWMKNIVFFPFDLWVNPHKLTDTIHFLQSKDQTINIKPRFLLTIYSLGEGGNKKVHACLILLLQFTITF